MQNTLDSQRRFVFRILLALCAAHIPLNALVAFLNDANPLLVAAASLLIALAAYVAYAKSPDHYGPITVSIAIMAEISLLVAAMRGHPWQVDIHMYYFAGLAIIGAALDVRAILAATATVAVHHLTLNYIMPELIYGPTGALGRVILHAVILAAEAAVLFAISVRMTALFAQVQTGAAAAEAASAEARAALAASQRAQADEKRAVQALEVHRRADEEETAATIGEVGRALQNFADGDLTYRIGAQFSARYETMKTCFNDTFDRLEGAIANVADTAISVSRSTQEISAAADDLAKRTQDQAHHIERTTSALHEMAAMLGATVESAEQAGRTVATARTDAEVATATVEEAVAAMKRISNSAQNINQIVSVIDEIAFQTNLLALNAGVEAARAGDAGRGFAVVASEVRALAQRSADSAREIKSLIAQSGGAIEDGVTLVNRSGHEFQQIIAKIAQINVVMDAIASSAKTHTANLHGVNESMTQMDHTIQHTAAIAEETTAAAVSLKNQATELETLLEDFKYRRETAHARAA